VRWRTPFRFLTHYGSGAETSLLRVLFLLNMNVEPHREQFGKIVLEI
jgi:hypothetical protein